MVPFCSYLPELCILLYIGGRSHSEESENTGVKCGKIRFLSCVLHKVTNRCNPADLKMYTAKNTGECWV